MSEIILLYVAVGVVCLPFMLARWVARRLAPRPPVYLPREYWKEIDDLSRPALMDVIWCLVPGGATPGIDKIRPVIDMVVDGRKREYE